jgi:hypothetical protein
MHLTYPRNELLPAVAFPDDSGEAGAPADEIDITPAMIAAGVEVLCDNRIEVVDWIDPEKTVAAIYAAVERERRKTTCRQ